MTTFDCIPFLSIVGAFVLGLCTLLGLLVLGRGAYAAAVVVWGHRAQLDRAAQDDFLYRMDRDLWSKK